MNAPYHYQLPPRDGVVVTHFLVVSNPDRSRDGGATDDKPTVTLTTPADPDTVSAFLNLRVADIDRAHREWSAQGALFLTDPVDHGYEIRAYIRDPDGHLIEVGQVRST